MKQQYMSFSPEQTRQIAEIFATPLPPGAVVALHGEMGAGKTCFVQGMARTLGISELVNSPTFTLINEYIAARPLYHVDLYRIGSEREALDLGLEDYFQSSGITAIEWPERIAPILKSTPHWQVHIRPGKTPDERIIEWVNPT